MRISIFAILFVALTMSMSMGVSAYAETLDFTTGTRYTAQVNGGATTSCSSSGGDSIGTDAASWNLQTRTSSQANVPSCIGLAPEFDISAIDIDATVTDVRLRFDIDAVSVAGSCFYRAIATQPSSLTNNSTNALALWNDIVTDGTVFVSSDSSCLTVGTDKILDLGSSADTDVQNAISSGDGWWSVGIYLDDSTSRDGVTDLIEFGDIELEVTYTPVAPPAISDLVCTFNSSGAPDYQVDCDWSTPSPHVIGYNIQRDGGSGFSVLVNDTSTPNILFYNDTSLANNMWQRYNVTSWNAQFQSPGSNIENATTIDPVNATVTTAATIVGDILGANATLVVLSGFPNATINDVRTFINSTLDDTFTAGVDFEDYNVISHYVEIGSGTTDVYQEIRVENFTNDIITFTSPEVSGTEDYDPDYFTSIQGGYNVNYTLSRDPTQTDLNLKVNRDPINFQIECNYQTGVQAVRNDMSLGEWTNVTDVGFLDDHQTVSASDNIYITCYNDELLFTTTSYTNSSQLLQGIAIYDEIYGSFLGVPVGVFFLVLAAGMANNRTAPIWVVLLLAIAGFMATIGFFTLDASVWALALIAGMLALFVGRKVI